MSSIPISMVRTSFDLPRLGQRNRPRERRNSHRPFPHRPHRLRGRRGRGAAPKESRRWRAAGKSQENFAAEADAAPNLTLEEAFAHLDAQ